MPLIKETEINFDEMTDEELTSFLDNLRAEASSRRPRIEAKSKAEKAPKKEKAAKEYIRIEL